MHKQDIDTGKAGFNTIPIRCQVKQTNNHGYAQQILVEKHQADTFPYSAQDQNFPHSSQSISSEISQDLAIKWEPAECLVKVSQQTVQGANYSTDIDNLEQSCFCNRALTYNILILNWFLPQIFEHLFSDRKIKPRFLYEYKVRVNGHIMKISIDSYIPIKDGKPIFAESIHNSIFPCLYEKLLAKIYGSFQNISESLTDLLQIFTLFHKQILPFYLFSNSPQKLIPILDQAHKSNSLVIFRTRNSVRLQTVGITSDCQYLMTRIIKIRQKCFVEFLEIDGTSWIGKYSKLRSFWMQPIPEIKQQQISTQQFSRQNYIEINDLIGLSRQFFILHNTCKYHKISFDVTSLSQKHTFRLRSNKPVPCRILIETSFLLQQCRSLIFILSSKHPSVYKIHSCSFKAHKKSNFIQFIYEPNTQYFLSIRAENLSNKRVPFVVSIASQPEQFIARQMQERNSVNQQNIALINMMYQHGGSDTYLDAYHNINPKDRSILKIKNCYKLMGLGLVLISLKPNFQGELKIEIDTDKLAANGIIPMNITANKLCFRPPCQCILIFKLKGRYDEGQCFPPKRSIKFLITQKGNTIQSIFQ